MSTSGGSPRKRDENHRRCRRHGYSGNSYGAVQTAQIFASSALNHNQEGPRRVTTRYPVTNVRERELLRRGSLFSRKRAQWVSLEADMKAAKTSRTS